MNLHSSINMPQNCLHVSFIHPYQFCTSGKGFRLANDEKTEDIVLVLNN
jgi:hypothetical protein